MALYFPMKNQVKSLNQLERRLDRQPKRQRLSLLKNCNKALSKIYIKKQNNSDFQSFPIMLV